MKTAIDDGFGCLWCGRDIDKDDKHYPMCSLACEQAWIRDDTWWVDDEA